MPKYIDILVVEDDPLVSMNYVDILEDAGFNVLSAGSLAQGRRELSIKDFSLIICDHDLGDGKGTTLVAELKNSGRNIPVIYLSAALSSVLRQIAELPLVKKVISKPVLPQDLLDSVNALVADVSLNRRSDKYQGLISEDERDTLLDVFKNIT